MNFNDALTRATALAEARLPDLQEDVFLIRDLFGRIRILLKRRRGIDSPFHPHIEALVADITGALGNYAYDVNSVVMYRQDFKELALPEDASSVVLAEQGDWKVCLHDRLITGTEWNAKPLDENKDPRRFTLFSMKGGVGRSTTAVVLSQHLATKGRRVLVFDLDLESPGVGSTLLGRSLPPYGIVDWFVEDALGNGASVLPELVQESHLADALSGRIAVVPAFGTDTGDYLAKLGRVTLERGPNGREPWADRLKRFVETVEAQETPDVVLLDSRTGLHDTSASLVMAMGANTLLFAIDTEQTWSAYRFLFRHWRQHPNREAFRDKLWVLGAMVPDTNRDDYVEVLRDHAWDLFSDSLYDAADATSDPDVFTFAPTDEIGNHHPRPIYWLRSLMAFDPLADDAHRDVAAAYGGFLDWFDRVLLEEGGEQP